MTDSQRGNRMFICTLLPFAILAQSCSDNLESALPAQDVTLKQGETLVVIKRQEESCTLEVLASRADNNSIVAKPQTLMKSESAFTLRLNDITRADAITLWAVCRDDKKRIVEMGKTVIAVPSSASAVRFETKRLPISGSWYSMTSQITAWIQNAIWAHSPDKAVITGNNGKLRIWNDFGWQERIYADFDCINFVDVTGVKQQSPAFITVNYDDPNKTTCSSYGGFMLDFERNTLLRKQRFDVLADQVRSSMEHYPGVGTVFIHSAVGSREVPEYIFSDRDWTNQDPQISKITDGSISYRKIPDGSTQSIAVSPFLLKEGPNRQPYPYWILTSHNSTQWLWKLSPMLSRAVAIQYDPDMPQQGALKIDHMIARKIVGSRSLAVAATWIVGEGLLQSPPPPPSPPPLPIIPVAIALPSGIAYATQELSSQDKPAMLDTNPLNCGKIYTPTSEVNTAYVLCSQGLLLNWLLTCRASADGTSVNCQSEKIDLADRSVNEKLVGIDGKGPNQLWLIGDQGGIWLYQK